MTSYRVSYRHDDELVENVPGGTLRTTPITSLTPWRAVNNHQGQNHQTSLQYHPRSDRHIPCESRLEQFAVQRLSCDLQVSHIVAQPFLLTWLHEERPVGHVPDLLARRLGLRPLLIDVKPAKFVHEPNNELAFSQTSEFCKQIGWEYAVWSEPSPIYLLNLRYLTGFFRVPFDVGRLRPGVLQLLQKGPRTIGEVAGALEPECLVRPVVFHMLWAQELVTDLELTLDDHRLLRIA